VGAITRYRTTSVREIVEEYQCRFLPMRENLLKRNVAREYIGFAFLVIFWISPALGLLIHVHLQLLTLCTHPTQ